MDMAVAQRPRRTQAERRAQTQGRLLDAAIDCLVDYGYGGTTTTVVSSRAGVSRGAQLHHYPTRADLVAAAIEHLFERMRRDYREVFPPGEGVDVGAAVDLLWSVFEKADFAAVLELYTAARTDDDLRERLAPVAEAHERDVYQLAYDYFPEIRRTELDSVLRTILDAMQGMAISLFVSGGLVDRDERLAALRSLARDALRTGAA